MNLYCRIYIVLFIKTYQRILLGNGSTWKHPQHQLWPTWQRMFAQKIFKEVQLRNNQSFQKSSLISFCPQNPRKIQCLYIKKKEKQKTKNNFKKILEIRNWGQSFVVFVRIGRTEKKIHSIFLDNNKTMQSSLPSWMEASWMPLFFALFRLNFIPLFEV